MGPALGELSFRLRGTARDWAEDIMPSPPPPVVSGAASLGLSIPFIQQLLVSTYEVLGTGK